MMIITMCFGVFVNNFIIAFVCLATTSVNPLLYCICFNITYCISPGPPPCQCNISPSTPSQRILPSPQKPGRWSGVTLIFCLIFTPQEKRMITIIMIYSRSSHLSWWSWFTKATMHPPHPAPVSLAPRAPHSLERETRLSSPLEEHWRWWWWWGRLATLNPPWRCLWYLRSWPHTDLCKRHGWPS